MSEALEVIIDEEFEEFDDHAPVSNEDHVQGAIDAEAPDFGELGPPDVAADVGIEPESGFEESTLEATFEAAAAGVEAEAEMDEELLLDAWYAEYGDPGTIAVMRRMYTIADSIPEVVIGSDDRVKINTTTTFPWRAICSLKITADDNSQWIGTGWLVGPRTLITAGHCIYIHRRGGWVKNIEVIPGRNGSSRPYGSCVATAFRSVKGWTQNKKRTHDYGAIILPATCRYGDQLGFFGYGNYSDSTLTNLMVNLSGYPGDKPAGTQWFHARRIQSVSSRVLTYDIDTAGGQSGSPVWQLKDGNRYAVGIHTNGSQSGNSATRIVKAVFDNIKNWKAQAM
jgi:V8-like Glu-specific endopeptidase